MTRFEFPVVACKALLAVVLFLAGGAPNSFAQQQGTTQVGVTVPRGTLQVRDIAYSPWQKTCFRVPASESICRTSIAGKMGTGQQVVRADIIERGDNGDKGEARLQLLLPPVYFIPAGIKVRIGDQQAEIPFLWCVSNACVAAGHLEQRLVAQLRTSKQISVEGVNVSLLTVSTAIPLDTFHATHEGPPARTFNEALEESH